MARHRDIRNMDYEDEYDAYDDVYGHSVDDDYYISPSNKQFIYNRESSRDSRFEHTEDDIQEVDEIEELSDTDKAKLNSCIDQIKDILGSTLVPRNELVNLIMKYKFNIDLVVNAILEDSRYSKHNGNATEKDVGPCLSNIDQPKLNCVKTEGLKFNIPKLFQQSNNQNELKTKFSIPNIFKSEQPNFSSKNMNDEGFNSLSDLVSSHLKNTNKLSNVDLSENTREKKLCTNDRVNNFNINLPSAKQPNYENKLKTNFLIPDIFKSEQPNFSSKNNFNIPNIFDSKNPNLNLISHKLSNVDLSENTRESKSCTNNKVNNFNIDLSAALKASNSLPNLPKVKVVPEKFEIPFIDCDFSKTDTQNFGSTGIMPCFLDIRKSVNFNKVNLKNATQFGKVVCSKYKHPKVENVLFKNRNRHSIKMFTFNTMSPDDIISFHLKR